MNTKLFYLYRDASNYKQHHAIIIEGAITEQEIRRHLWDGEYFIPSILGLPNLQERFREQGFAFPTEDDHPWHEIESISGTEAAPTEGISATQFLRRLRSCEKAGWERYALGAEFALHGAR